MSKYFITTVGLVDIMQKCSTNCRYVSLLNIPNDHAADFVIDLLHSALQEIFLSQEYLEEYEYQTLLTRYINPQQLFNAAKMEHRLQMVSNQITIFRNIESLPSTLEMVSKVFDKFYCEFVECIRTFMGGEDINPYRIINVKSTNPNESFVIEVKGDIRVQYYMEQFPDGRYKPTC